MNRLDRGRVPLLERDSRHCDRTRVWDSGEGQGRVWDRQERVREGLFRGSGNQSSAVCESRGPEGWESGPDLDGGSGRGSGGRSG